jgi:hypothetical protein
MLRTELTSTLSKDRYGHIFFALLLQLFLVERVVSGCCGPRNAFTDSCLFCAFVFISILESFFSQTTTSGFFFLICRLKYAMNSSVSLLWIELFRTSIVELPVDFLFTVLFQISFAKFSSSVDFVFQ